MPETIQNNISIKITILDREFEQSGRVPINRFDGKPNADDLNEHLRQLLGKLSVELTKEYQA